MNVTDIKKAVRGEFEKAPQDIKQIVMEVAANFHYRTMTRHEDGSWGDIRISPGQLNDCLAYMARKWRPRNP